MQIWEAIFLGLVQGLAEFLPISSSGHLVFFQTVLNIEEADLFFDVMLHVGTLFAVFFVFWRDILELFRKPFRTLLYLIVATIPAAIVGFLFSDEIEEIFYGGEWLGVFFLLTAVMMFACELVAKRRKKTYPLCWRTTVPMGLMQAVAVLPGISRSGSTIAAGVFAGAETRTVSKFSFLMSVPVILGSAVLELKDLIFDGGFQSSVAEYPSAGMFIACVLIGVAVAAVSGLFAIKVMLKVINTGNYKWFSLYLVLLSVACFILSAYNLL